MFWDQLKTFLEVTAKVTAGNAQATASAFNARVSRHNASSTAQQGRVEESRIRREGRRRAGEIRANVGASGFSIEGSASDLLAESTYNSEYDALSAKYSYQSKSQNESLQADLYDRQGRDAKRGAYVGAASTLLTSKQFTSSSEPFSLGGGLKRM